MKKIYTLFLALIFAGSLMAQTPQGFKYQAVARETSGDVIADQAVGMQISILQGSTSGTAVYVETFSPTTNEFGLMNLNIGAGTVVSGDLTTINWSADTYFLKIEMDITGGTAYEEYGTSQLLSVPYALHAKTAETFTGTITETDPLFTVWDKTTGISITESQISDLNHFTNTDETDQIFTASVAENITVSDTTRWGSTAGTEVDPLFTAWDKSAGISITESQISDLDHFTTSDETDPVFGAHAANGITSTNITNWTTAFGWGDHSAAGYLTSFTELDPVFVAHAASGVTSTLIGNWNSAYGWGNHLGLYRPIGYVPAWSEITSKPTTITGFGITDAMNTSHAANAITSTNITNWNTAFGWGDHSIVGYITDGNTGWDNSYGFITASSSETLTNKSGNISMWTNDAVYLTDYTETDPVFNNLFSITSPTNDQLLKYNSGTSKWGNWTANFLTTEVDGDITNEIQDLSNVLAQGTDAGTKNIVNTGVIGVGTSTPDASAALEVNSSTKGFLPPSLSNTERNAISSPAAGLIIFNSDENILQIFDGSIWRNISMSSCAPSAPGSITGETILDPNETGVFYSIEPVSGATNYHWTVPADATVASGQGTTNITVDFGIQHHGNVSVRAENECGNSNYTNLEVIINICIGTSWAGGIVFYIDGTGEHGLVCAENDQSYGVEWGCYGTITGADGTAVGTGAQNTVDILANCLTSGIAAKICAELSLNGYDDWFLPSIDALEKMWELFHPSFYNQPYWSSTEFNVNQARVLEFSDPYMHTNFEKNDPVPRVRAVRAF